MKIKLLIKFRNQSLKTENKLLIKFRNQNNILPKIVCPIISVLFYTSSIQVCYTSFYSTYKIIKILKEIFILTCDIYSNR